MPTWGEQLQELRRIKTELDNGPSIPGGPSPHDVLRRQYLKELHDHTKRAVIIYATCWLEGKPSPTGEALTLTLGDKQGFMEAVSNISEKKLDLIITSPGGSAEAAESIMDYLRTRFEHIRAVIPVAAMSAATMMALACDEILMGTHSQLGPIDPQFTIPTPEGPRSSPAQAILDQFELAKEECKDLGNLGAWLPLLRSLSPGLLAQCQHSREQAERFVSEQLETHMLSENPALASEVAKWFANFTYFKSHNRAVTVSGVEAQKLNVTRLEKDDDLQDLVLSVHHAVRHTFNDTGTTKLIENHHGRAYIEGAPVLVGQVPIQQNPQSPTPPPRQNRQQRRQAQRKR